MYSMINGPLPAGAPQRQTVKAPHIAMAPVVKGTVATVAVSTYTEYLLSE